MSVELVVAGISGVVALAGVALSGRATRKQALLSAELTQGSARRARSEQRQDVMSRYRDPLLWAAFDLQSRLENIAVREVGFLTTHYACGSPRTREYARRNTLFVLAEYLGWVEIIRLRVRFLDLGDREDNRRIVALLFEVGKVLSSDGYADARFSLFRGEQRAIGELMVADGGESCIGYAEFCRRLDTDSAFAAWFDRPSDDIEESATRTAPAGRLVDLRNSLLELIQFLDPDGVRFPADQRHQVPGHRLSPDRADDADRR
ncbi:hypothetical protein ACIA74_32185 [Streptomyces sp. NPDC051658]|uniref:hypothetical protein n=1 Tax=Streptomyces sp. NPDC051658 TaxID=3365667 RepID=UPI00379855C6